MIKIYNRIIEFIFGSRFMAAFLLLLAMLNVATSVYLAVSHVQQYSVLAEEYQKKEDALNAAVNEAENSAKEVKEKYERLKEKYQSAKDEIDKLQDDIVNTQAQSTSIYGSDVVVGNAYGNYAGEFTITYYCGENYPHECGTSNGITASGATATVGVTVAADPNVLPIGTEIYIDGIGNRIVQDTGGAIIGNRIDVFVGSHSEALQNGTHIAQVYYI